MKPGNRFRVCTALIFLMLLLGAVYYIALQKQQEVCLLEKQNQTLAKYWQWDNDSLSRTIDSIESELAVGETLWRVAIKAKDFVYKDKISQLERERDALLEEIDTMRAWVFEGVGLNINFAKRIDSLEQEIDILKRENLILRAIYETPVDSQKEFSPDTLNENKYFPNSG